MLREILRTSLSRLVGGVDILVLPKGQFSVNDYQKVEAELLKCLEGLGLLMKGAEAPTSIQDAEG